MSLFYEKNQLWSSLWKTVKITQLCYLQEKIDSASYSIFPFSDISLENARLFTESILLPVLLK